jgi:hypothetical protein
MSADLERHAIDLLEGVGIDSSRAPNQPHSLWKFYRAIGWIRK